MPPAPLVPPKRRRRARQSATGAQLRDAGPNFISVSNVVATANFGVKLDLRRIAWSCCGEYNPDSFAAASLRLRNPKTTALVFSSGRLVCTGAPSERAAVCAMFRAGSRGRVLPVPRRRAVVRGRGGARRQWMRVSG